MPPIPGIAFPTIPSAADAPPLDLLYRVDLAKEGRAAQLLEPRPPLGMRMLAMQHVFARSERLAPDELLRQQLRQLDLLLRHAVREVPYYRDLLPRTGYDPGRPLTPDLWCRLPVLTRPTLQSRRDELRAAAYPAEHGARHEYRSSGSTGVPISAFKTDLCGLLWEAITLRDHLWHRRDFAGSFAAFRTRKIEGGDGVTSSIWNWGVNAAFRTGPGLMLDGPRTTEERIAWLLRIQPTYLLTPPTMLRELLCAMERQPIRLERLKGVSTFAEQVPPGLREECLARLGVPLKDLYTCREVGYLALECPDHAHYHVQAETVLVEILDEQDRPCAAGEVGRVVATPLHNFAMPLIRYAVGDYAEAGAPCPCGRGLPVLRRILGRARNRLKLPGGNGKWIAMEPLEKRIRDLPVKQYQLVQRAFDEIEVRIVPLRPLAAADEEAIRSTLRGSCGAEGCGIRFAYVEAIHRSEGGKYEDFMSEVA
jgi:phenylacetate-CoA ligase